jgi:hypothetical protein
VWGDLARLRCQRGLEADRTESELISGVLDALQDPAAGVPFVSVCRVLLQLLLDLDLQVDTGHLGEAAPDVAMLAGSLAATGGYLLPWFKKSASYDWSFSGWGYATLSNGGGWTLLKGRP